MCAQLLPQIASSLAHWWSNRSIIKLRLQSDGVYAGKGSLAAKPWPVAGLVAFCVLLTLATAYAPVVMFPACPPSQVQVRTVACLTCVTLNRGQT